RPRHLNSSVMWLFLCKVIWGCMNKLFDVNLSPTQFEEEVAKLIRRQGIGLSEFEVKKLEKISVQDGIYEIDITARFEVLGVSFLVLIECKHHKNPIK